MSQNKKKHNCTFSSRSYRKVSSDNFNNQERIHQVLKILQFFHSNLPTLIILIMQMRAGICRKYVSCNSEEQLHFQSLNFQKNIKDCSLSTWYGFFYLILKLFLLIILLHQLLAILLIKIFHISYDALYV